MVFNVVSRSSSFTCYNINVRICKEYKGMAVIDVKGYRYDTIGRLWHNLINIAVKLGLKKPFVIQ